ncbi:MAG: UDP-N-acetylmuramate--L-alanine ligase, partial [Chloroflexota bacterium]|nr:UDP-N-acetylmuramate--L-alanine ligase [Chloroflexota bacterium]
LQPGPTTERLEAAGARIFPGHAAEHVRDADYVVRSAAVPSDNPEVRAAQARGVPTRKLAEAVGELMRERRGVAIAGTHGKTTTTALVAWLLHSGGLDPLALIGGDAPAFPGGARLGNGPMVVEADEYDRRFLSYWPEVAVVTSIEPDHLDYYRDLAEIRDAFQELASRLPRAGRLVTCADEPCAASLQTSARRETYGFAAEADWRVSEHVAQPAGGARFTLTCGGRHWPVVCPLPGEHNARNAAAAIAVADYFGVGLRTSIVALEQFQGVRRRFEVKAEARGIRIVDDYAHHPTEVAAVLKTARATTAGQVWVVFQPHTTNRTAAMLDEFASAFQDAQHALILPIYRPHGRELDERPVTSADLVARMARHPDAQAIASFDDAVEIVTRGARAGDLVLTMGAGDVTNLAPLLARALQ